MRKFSECLKSPAEPKNGARGWVVAICGGTTVSARDAPAALSREELPMEVLGAVLLLFLSLSLVVSLRPEWTGESGGSGSLSGLLVGSSGPDASR